MKTKIKVVEVIVNGGRGYLKETHCFSQEPITQNPFDAIQYGYTEQETKSRTDSRLLRDLGDLVVPGDRSIAKSGLRIDKLPEVVELLVEITSTEVTRVLGRELST